MDIPNTSDNSHSNHISHSPRHGFTQSPSRTPVVFGSVGRGGMLNRLSLEPEFDDYHKSTQSEAASLARQEEEILRDSGISSSPLLSADQHYRTTSSSSRLLTSKISYGALNNTQNNDDSENETDTATTSSQEETRLIGKVWDEAVEHGGVHTTVKRELIYMARASMPLTLTFLLQYSLTVASVFSVGHLGRNELGAVSLASMTANITGFALIQGLATCLDTLCAQAYGAGSYHQVGEYFQKCTLMVMVFFIPVGVLWFFSRPLLSMIVDEPELVTLSVQYLRIVLISIPAYIAFECGKRFVQAQGIFHASTIVLVICAPINAVLNYVLVWNPTFGLGFVGAPLAVAISTWLMAILLFLYVFFIDGRKCWGGFSYRVFQRWGVMVRLAIPGVIMVEAEFLAFEILTLASSRFGTAALAAQSVISTTLSLLYQIPFAVGIASSTRVANFVGASLSDSAKITTYVSLWISVAIAVIDCLVCYYFRYSIGSAFSNDEDVIEMVANLVPVILFIHSFDAPGAILAGLLRGIGRQRIGGYLNLFFYYVVAVPLCLYLAFVLDYGLLGLWLGIGFALVLLAVIETIYLFHCDWDEIVREAEARQQLSEEEFA